MRRRRLGCWWTILKPVLVLSAFLAAIAVLAFSWAIPLPGRETLTGEWVGELRSSRGPPGWLYLDLEVDQGYRLRPFAGRTRLGDAATVCTGRRRIELLVTGYTTAWSGKSLELLLQPKEPSPPELRFDLAGTWDGHVLELKEPNRSLAEALNQPNDSAGSDPAGGTQWISASLRRGTRGEFNSHCGRS